MHTISKRTAKTGNVGDELMSSLPTTCPQVKLPKNSDHPMVVFGGGASLASAMEGFKSLRTKLMMAQTGRDIRSVAITSAAVADGKTMTSFNLACFCAQLEDTPVLLIDGDLRTRGLTKMIGSLPAAGLSNVLAGTASCEDVLVRTDVPNLYVIGAGLASIPATELFSSDRWPEVMNWASSVFKLVVVDALPSAPLADFELIAAACDSTLLVVRARSTPRASLEMALEQIDPKKMLGVVWNGASQHGAYYTAYL